MTRARRFVSRELAWKERPSEDYRTDRLEEERELLTRRLTWAIRRADPQAVERLTQRLEAIEEAIDADLAPGRPANRFERWR
jgi:hypothetical protein